MQSISISFAIVTMSTKRSKGIKLSMASEYANGPRRIEILFSNNNNKVAASNVTLNLILQNVHLYNIVKSKCIFFFKQKLTKQRNMNWRSGSQLSWRSRNSGKTSFETELTAEKAKVHEKPLCWTHTSAIWGFCKDNLQSGSNKSKAESKLILMAANRVRNKRL